ncbi:MAG: single-stranded DNA-binding protein [Actinomycetota bacterium]
MANGNNVVLIGNLTDDPELRFTPNGAAVANFRIAVNRVYNNRNGEKVEETDFFRVNVWRGLAENVAESLSKGTRVVVTGRLRSRSWETEEGQKRSVVEVEADEVAPSLRFATAKVEKTSRGGGFEGGSWEAPSGGTGEVLAEAPDF